MRSTQQRAVASGYETGFERGLAAGREQGRVEGMKEVRDEAEREARAAREAVAARIARLDQLLSTLPTELARRLAAAEDDMVALCHAVVCRVLGEQLVTRDGVSACVRQALRAAAGGSALDSGSAAPVAIHVHPRDVDALCNDEQLSAWLARSAPDAAPVRWIADDRVQLGGCIVRSGAGGLDARLETQLASLRDLLVRSWSGEPTTAAGEGPPTTEGRR